MRRYRQFEAAKKLLANGYPLGYVATKVGVHRNSVLSWSRLLGYSARTRNKGRTQRLNSLFRRIQRLSKSDRTMLLGMLRSGERVTANPPCRINNG